MQPKFISRITWPPPGHYIVAVSGGVDSVALLHLLASQQMERGWRLRVAHVNHGWRADADLDQKLVRDIAKVYNLPFHATTLSLAKKSEETARTARYEFLQKLINQFEAHAVITAHHQDDRHETSWFQVARGTGRRGTLGLRSTDLIIRPLLGVKKTELIEYAQANGLPWREDSSNSDISLDRNFVRHELMPLARQAAPGFEDQLQQRLDKLQAVNAQIDQKIARLINLSGEPGVQKVTLSANQLGTMSQAKLGEVISIMIKTLEPGLQLSSRLVKHLALLAKTGRIGREHSVSARMIASRNRAGFVVSEIQETVQQLVAQDLFEEGSVRFGDHQLSYGTLVCIDDSHPHIGSDQIKVRRVLPGDRIDPVGMSGTKKLQDLFVDAKIDRDRRAAWPVVARASDNQVVWVPRLAVSRSVSLKQNGADARCLIHQFL